MNKLENQLDRMLDMPAFIPKSHNGPSAWIGHMPFAAWVIRELSPGIFVELGTHTGASYFAFCQSVREWGLDTKCYAVDTWQGDEHAGYYDDRIFQKVSLQNSENYATFSRLMRMTFSEAANFFSDQSVGLLHIDGLHTYEAVRDDFERWLPKMSPGGLILFHDTNVREREFGVWKLFEELKERYPHNLEFTHSSGLGVVRIDGAKESDIDWLEPDSSAKSRVHTFFSALGFREMERYAFIEERNGLIESTAQEVSEKNDRILGLTLEVDDRNKKIRSLNDHISSQAQRIRLLESVVDSARKWQKKGWVKRAFHKWRPRL
jgi:hypothetical protein